MENDDDLILRCGRDPAAFRALVERHQGRIYGFLMRLAGRERADDLFQEVWLKVLLGPLLPGAVAADEDLERLRGEARRLEMGAYE